MASGKSFIASQRANHAHVERTALLEEVDGELVRTGVVVLCAPWGYGKSDLLRDYARIAHARTPLRPIIRVDFASPEAQAYLNGSTRLLRHALEREMRGALWLSESCVQCVETGSSAQASESSDEEGSSVPAVALPRKRGRRRGGATPEVGFIQSYLEALAPRWYGRCEGSSRCGDMAFGEMPLITVDNLPPMDEEAAGSFADAVRCWVREGARVLAGCTPSNRAPCGQLPEASVLDSEVLAVSPSEMGTWSRELRLSADCDLPALTRGVPYLVDACRSSLPGAAGRGTYLRAVDQVVDHCLDESMCVAAEQARWAMVMLGEGRLGDLTAVGVSLREDELGILASSFPLFGIDRTAGGFGCVPLGVSPETRSVVRSVAANEVLSERCVELLIARGDVERAGALAALMSDSARLRLYAWHPDVFADAAHDGSIARSLRSASLGDGLDHTLRPGLARLARMHALAHDLPVRTLSEQAIRYSAGTSEGAHRALRCVLGYWRDYGSVRVGEPAFGEVLLPAGEGVDSKGAGAEEGGAYLEGFGLSTEEAAAGGEDDGIFDIDAVVAAMGSAAFHGDAALYRERLQALGRLVPFARGGLAAALYATHAALCGLLCSQAETVLAWLGPLAERCRRARMRPDRVGTVSDALLGSMQAVARVLVEKPSARATAEASLAVLRDARVFFEGRDIAPGAVFIGALEAFCQLVAGEERRASDLLRACQARWGVRGVLVGQMAASLGLSVAGLAKDEVNQARVHAQTAEALAHRLGLRRGVWLARLFETVAAIRNGNGPDVDRRLLEATLRQSSLHPAVSIPLTLEVALLYAVEGEEGSARDILRSVGLFDHAGACRLLVVALRALGRERGAVLDLLPRSLRSEYESLRPSSILRRVPEDGRAADKPGLLSLSPSGSGLSIRLFGGFKAAINGHAMENAEWGRRKARSLLALLALFPEQPLSRDAVIRALWKERSPSLARNALNTTLTSMRTSLGQKSGGPQYVVSSGNTLALNPMLVDTDVQRFERLARTLLTRRDGAEASEVVSACSVLEQTYQTGLGSDVEDLAPFAAARANEIASLFVQCMVVGADLALAEGDAQLSLWFARAAARAGFHRDDVRRCLEKAVTALESPEGKPNADVGAAVDEILAQETSVAQARKEALRPGGSAGRSPVSKKTDGRKRAVGVKGQMVPA